MAGDALRGNVRRRRAANAALPASVDSESISDLVPADVNGDGGVVAGTAGSISSGTPNAGVAVANLNRDGRLDVVTRSGAGRDFDGGIAVLLGR